MPDGSEARDLRPGRTPGTLVAASTLGSLDRDRLAAALRPLWEDAGPLVDRLVGRHVDDWDAHLAAAVDAIGAMTDDERADLLRAHPRIGASPAVLASRSAQSWAEQGGAAAVDERTTAALESGNDAYEDRFGFPLVEWVAGRPRDELVAVVGHRLTRDRATELDAGCTALVAIARDRLTRLRSTTS